MAAPGSGPPQGCGIEIEYSAGATVFRVKGERSRAAALAPRCLFAVLAAGYGLALVADAARDGRPEIRPFLSVVYVAFGAVAMWVCRFRCDRAWQGGEPREILRIDAEGLHTRDGLQPLAGVEGFRVAAPASASDVHDEMDCRARRAPLWPSSAYGVAALRGGELTTLAVGIEAHQARAVAEGLAAVLGRGAGGDMVTPETDLRLAGERHPHFRPAMRAVRGWLGRGGLKWKA